MTASNPSGRRRRAGSEPAPASNPGPIQRRGVKPELSRRRGRGGGWAVPSVAEVRLLIGRARSPHAWPATPGGGAGARPPGRGGAGRSAGFKARRNAARYSRRGAGTGWPVAWVPRGGGGRRPRSHGMHVRRYLWRTPSSFLQSLHLRFGVAIPVSSEQAVDVCCGCGSSPAEGYHPQLSWALADHSPNLISYPYHNACSERVAFPHPLLTRCSPGGRSKEAGQLLLFFPGAPVCGGILGSQDSQWSPGLFKSRILVLVSTFFLSRSQFPHQRGS